MADNPSTATSACVNCMDEIQLWVSHNTGTDWWQVPFVTRVQKQASRTNAQQIKLNGTSENVCSASSKAWTYLINVWKCMTAPWQNFITDGQQVWGRIVNGNDLAADEQEVALLTLDDDGYTLDTESNTPQQDQLRLNASTIYRRNFTDVAGTPNTGTDLNPTIPNAAGGGVDI